MASIPGAAFNISGASGSQGLLGPKSGWQVYVFPRGGHAAQDSTGTSITFDSSSVAARFAANNWVQVGLSTANIRKVSVVAANVVIVQGAVTVAENDRVFLIGNTQPSVSGGSATYITPASIIRQRDDDAADIFTNSKVTTNSDGLCQFWANPSIYDCIIQDGNQANQGSIIDLPVGAVEGISTSAASVFGATVTFLAGVSMNTTLVVGQSVTLQGQLGVTGHATFGATVTVQGALGVTGPTTFGSTVTFQGNMTGVSVTGPSTFGNTVTFLAPVGFSSTARFGVTTTFLGPIQLQGLRYTQGTGPGVFLSSTFGASSFASTIDPARDAAFQFYVSAFGAGMAANPTATVTLLGTTTFANGYWIVTTCRSRVLIIGGTDQPTVPFIPLGPVGGFTQFVLTFAGTPVSGETYGCNVFVVGVS